MSTRRSATIPIVPVWYYESRQRTKRRVQGRRRVTAAVRKVCVEGLPHQLGKCPLVSAAPLIQTAPPSSRSGFFWPPYTVHYTAGLCTGSGEWRFWQERTFLRLGKRDPDDNEVEGEWNHAEEVKRQAFLWIAEEVARDGQAVGKKCG